MANSYPYAYPNVSGYSGLRTLSATGATRAFVVGQDIEGYFNLDPTDTTSADNGGTIIVDGSGNRWKRVFGNAADVKWFGAVGDGVSDDTAAIQNAINWHLANPGSQLQLSRPSVTYKISAALEFGGTTLTSIDVVGCKFYPLITQYGANLPAFQFNNTNFAHDNRFRDLSATASAATTAPMFYFPSTGNSDFYNCTLENITCNQFTYVYKSVGPSFWGNRLINHVCYGGMTGGLISAFPDHQTGQPNNYLDKVYIDATNMAGPIITGASWELQWNAIEINQALRGPAFIVDTGGGSYVGNKFRCEVGTWAANQTLFDTTNGQLVCDFVGFYTATISSTVYMYKTGANAANVSHVRLTQVGGTTFTGSGNFFYVAGTPVGENAPSSEIRLDFVENLTGNSWSDNGNLYGLVNNGSTTGAVGLVVTSWNDESRTAYPTAGSYTLTPDAAPVQIIPALSANATVTLPGNFTNAVFEGRKFTFVKTDKAGAGTLTLSAVVGAPASNGSLVIPATSCARLTVQYKRFQWNLVEYVTW